MTASERGVAAAISSSSSPSVSLRGRSTGSFIARLALLAEGGDALGEMRAGAHLVAELLLLRFAGEYMVGDRRGHLAFHRLHCRRALGGDPLRGLDPPTDQLAALHHAIDEPEPRRLLGIDQPRRQQQ